MRYVREQWGQLLEDTLMTVYGPDALLDYNLELYLQFASDGLEVEINEAASADSLLEVASTTALSVLAELDNLSMTYNSFPHLFCLMPSLTSEEQDSLSKLALEEWRAVLACEASHPAWLGHHAPHTTFQWYREQMTAGA